MKRHAITTVIAIMLCATTLRIEAASSARESVIVVNGPTVVAFFHPVTDAALKKDEGLNSTLDDFSAYTSQASGPLQRKGIKLYQRYSGSFRLRAGHRTWTFPVGQKSVGYYFIAPGRKPHIESGVMTDTDLLQAADRYFTLKAH